MNLELHKISGYKNKLCIVNLMLCVAFISLGYTDSVTSIKSIVGIVFATLCPILWDSWLYSEMFKTDAGKSLVSFRTFLWVGFFLVISTTVVLIFSLLMGTL